MAVISGSLLFNACGFSRAGYDKKYKLLFFCYRTVLHYAVLIFYPYIVYDENSFVPGAIASMGAFGVLFCFFFFWEAFNGRNLILFLTKRNLFFSCWIPNLLVWLLHTLLWLQLGLPLSCCCRSIVCSIVCFSHWKTSFPAIYLLSFECSFGVAVNSAEQSHYTYYWSTGSLYLHWTSCSSCLQRLNCLSFLSQVFFTPFLIKSRGTLDDLLGSSISNVSNDDPTFFNNDLSTFG